MLQVEAVTPRAVRGRRPTDVPYSEEVCARVLERLAAGETLTAICESDWAPAWSTWHDWLDSRPDLADAYARARRLQSYAYVDKIRIVSTNAKDVPAAKLEAESLKWIAVKLNPRELGDSVQLKHADANGEKLDTAPLVASLLSSMQPQANTQPIDVTPRVVAKREEAPARGDARAPDLDVSDLV